MKNILMIAYYYPPKGGIGVQRNTKFAKYLSKFGHNMHVLTVDEAQCGTLVDHSLDDDVLDDIKVYRTFIKEGHLIDRLISVVNRNDKPSGSGDQPQYNEAAGKTSVIKQKIRRAGKKLVLDLNSLIYIPDAQKGWVKYAVEEGKRIIKENGIDVIYTTSSPYTAHIIGYKLAMEFPVKWVADFRDPWVQNSFVDYNPVAKCINSILEKKVVRRADAVTSVSQPIINDFLSRYKSQKKGKFHLVTNGYDEEDFKYLELNASDNNEKFTLLYNGTLYGKETPDPVFIAVKNLIDRGMIDRGKIRVRFIGDMGSRQREVYERYKNMYPEIYERRDFVSHGESLSELCKANALLLIIDDMPGSERIYTGKIFEYIRTGKPILGIIPGGVATELIVNTNTGYVAHPLKQNEIDDIFYKAYKAYFDRASELKPVQNKIIQYSRERIASKLSDIIENT